MGQHVVIAGAGHAGVTITVLLRQQGFDGAITLVGDEPVAPYQRPPLSILRPDAYLTEQRIAFRRAESVVQIDCHAKQVSLSDASVLGYDKLVITTGAHPIFLPIDGADLAGVHVLRTMADAERLRISLDARPTDAVVGGGYIGLEVAASARALGCEVVVLEREARPLARVACEQLSTFFQAYHERQGIAFELGCRVVGLIGDGLHVSGVKLADGRVIAVGAVVLGVGARPNDSVAEDAGIETANGIVVDENSRSVSHHDVFALGDVAYRPIPICDRLFPMESVPNALEQAKQAAAAILGQPRPADECSWQWSDQYDLELQIAGYAFDSDATILRRNPDEGFFALFHMRGDLVRSVEAVSSPPEFLVGRRLILARTPVSRSRLADADISMKTTAAGAA